MALFIQSKLKFIPLFQEYLKAKYPDIEVFSLGEDGKTATVNFKDGFQIISTVSFDSNETMESFLDWAVQKHSEKCERGEGND